MLLSFIQSPYFLITLAVLAVGLVYFRAKIGDDRADRRLQDAREEFELSQQHPSLRGRKRIVTHSVEVPRWIMLFFARLGFTVSTTTLWSEPTHLEDLEDQL